MSTPHSREAEKPKKKFTKIAKTSEITTQAAYRLQILEALIEMGGSARTTDVLSRIFKKMKGRFKPKDMQKIPSGISVRWKNKAQWERMKLLNEGYLKKDMPRGIWEITDAGRKRYESLKERR